VVTRTLWLATVPRIVLGAIFASAAVSYFWSVVFGWMLLPVPTTAQAMQFAGVIIKIGYLWPLMKAINRVAGYAGHYAGMFMNDGWSPQESTP
jgi:hypothetical protein